VAGVVTPVGGVLVGVAVATATAVYLETIDLKGAPIYNAETKSICEAEAECGSEWSGGSGTYPTRFFSIKPGQKSRIIVSYEFYDVPDTIQVRRGTKVLWSRSGSGKGSEEFNENSYDVPQTSEWDEYKDSSAPVNTIGVTVIGNPSQTKWDVKVSVDGCIN
jgi:hypothetical protein